MTLHHVCMTITNSNNNVIAVCVAGGCSAITELQQVFRW